MFYLKKQCIIILGGVIMAFKKIIDKSKDIFKVVKDKTIDAIEKGNLELKKFTNTKDVAFISSPVIAGYETKKAFYEEGCLLFPIECLLLIIFPGKLNPTSSFDTSFLIASSIS